jgi:hypothetical protein
MIYCKADSFCGVRTSQGIIKKTLEKYTPQYLTYFRQHKMLINDNIGIETDERIMEVVKV